MPESHDPEYGGPLWVPAEAPDENGVTTEAAARALADGKRFDVAKATAFFRNRVQAGHVVPYGRSTTDKRKPYLFRPEQVLVAAVLRKLTELPLTGVPLEAAALRLQAFRGDTRNPARSEIDFANPPKNGDTPARRLWREFETGLPFHVALHLQWTSKGCMAYLSLGDDLYFGQRPEDNVVPVADLVVPISPLVPVLISRLGKAD
ncbi:hypothetical protein [Albidovulum sp.]|uniref:hypothetical protein n=1 Tax=Albidovulum sp. TaxID=1872424 RepID=UPI003529268D